jgi:predicted acyltransferase
MIANVVKSLRLISLLLMSAAIYLALGSTWHLIFPINKTLWTRSLILVSVGCSILLLVIFYYLFDVLKLTKLATFYGNRVQLDHYLSSERYRQLAVYQ